MAKDGKRGGLLPWGEWGDVGGGVLVAEFFEVFCDFGVDDGLVVGDFGVEDDAKGIDSFLVEGVVFLFGDSAEEGDVQFGVAVEHV